MFANACRIRTSLRIGARGSGQLAYSHAVKYYTKIEVFEIDKRTNLLLPKINDRVKSVITKAPVELPT